MAVGDYGAGLSPDLWQSLLPYMGGDYSSALSTQNKQMGNIDDIIGLLLSPEFAMLSGTYSAPQMQQFPTSTPKTSVYKNSEFEDIRNIALGIEQGVYDDATAQNMLRQAVLDGRLPGFTTDQTDAMVTQMWDEIRQNEANAIQFYADQEANAASDSVLGQAGLPTGEYFANYSDGNLETNYGGIDPLILKRVLAAQQGIANRTAAFGKQQDGVGPSVRAGRPAEADKIGLRQAVQRIDAGDVQYVQARQDAGGVNSADRSTAVLRLEDIEDKIGTDKFAGFAVKSAVEQYLKSQGKSDAKFVSYSDIRKALQNYNGLKNSGRAAVDRSPLSDSDIEQVIQSVKDYEEPKKVERGDPIRVGPSREDFRGGSNFRGGYEYDATPDSGDGILGDTYLKLLKGQDRAASAQAYGYAKAAIAGGASPTQDALQQRIAMLRAAGIIQ